MTLHNKAMQFHQQLNDSEVRSAIRTGLILLGGNYPNRIYGQLNCKVGKRMLRKNRVFFASAGDAVENGFRPCGNCMRNEFQRWKNGLV